MITENGFIDYRQLGKNIKNARMHQNKRQADVAKVLKVSDTYYGKIENGIAKPNLERLLSICLELQLSLAAAFQSAIKSESASIQFGNPYSNDKYLCELQRLLEQCSSDSSKETMVTICKAVLKLENT